MGQSRLVLNQDTRVKKVYQNFLDVMRPLFILWKGMEDIKYASNDTEPVLVEDHIKLIEQAVFIVGPASELMLHI